MVGKMIELATRHVVGRSGERLKILVDKRSGVPLFYPNLYVTSQVRGGAKSVATIQSFMTSMKVFYSWCADYSIDIERRWAQGEWFKIWELDSLRDHCGLPLRLVPPRMDKVVRIRRSSKLSTVNVDSPTKYIRMTFIADYLKWLAEIVLAERAGTRAPEVDAMYRAIKSRRPKKKGRNHTSREDKGLDPKLLEEVLEVSKPGHALNPYGDYSVQHRNASVIALLHYLGVRRGELLNLRVDDVDFVANEIKIIRRADTSIDKRVYQPLVKTEERTLPINDKLAERLSDYVTRVRSVYPRARRHPYLFVTHKKGPYQGDPLSNSGFGKLMSTLQSVAEEFSQVHAHAFRHSWNYSFSKVLDQSPGKHSPEREEQMRSYLMGWKETSGTALTYNRRHTKEKAKEAVLAFQSNIGQKRGESGE